MYGSVKPTGLTFDYYCVLNPIKQEHMPALLKIPSIETTLHQFLTPAQFLRIVRTDKKAIKKSEFIPPKIGSRDFGKVYVEYYYVPGTARTAKGGI
jgi:hypothetical protein